MGKINYGRVILGGLLAGLIINVGEFALNGWILMNDWNEAMKALNRPEMGGGAMAVMIVLSFGLGIMLTWTYAAIRPRFGAGPKTAICAGLLVWALAYAWASLGGIAMDIFPVRLYVIGMIWGLFEAPISAIAGAWIYREA